jgi:hypothetical protein
MRSRELTAARKRLGLTQERLARALETGRDPIPRAIALAVEALEYRARRPRKTA